MQELVACPVCTLYLRPGMTLEDHLETHPKEQVIKALVSLSLGVSSTPSRGYQPQVIGTTAAVCSPYNNNNNTSIHGGYSQQPDLTECHFSPPPPPPPRQNVMIVNRQSTTVYHTNHGLAAKEPPPPARMAQPNFIAPPQLQIFTLSPHNPTATSRLPPPPAYGTAINQLRSQQNQIHVGLHTPPHSALSMPPPSSPNRNTSNRSSPNQMSPTSVVNIHQNPCLLFPHPPPSPSVLRYADSPVSARYVERENGDFIVQESPRHVVECVETENGRFSVIERVIQSPPSVVQFQDCDKANGSDSEEMFAADMHCDHHGEERPLTAPPDEEIDDDIDSVTSEAMSSYSKESGVKDVTVLSNVKLDPNESLEIMENLENIQKASVQAELIWSGITDIRKDAESRMDNTGKRNNENEDVSEEPSVLLSAATATSVIRLAANKSAASIDDSEEEKIGTDCKYLVQKDVRSPPSAKRPFRKQPKKLTVKFKVAIPGIESSSTEKSAPDVGLGSSATSASETDTQVQSCNLVVDLDTLKVNEEERIENESLLGAQTTRSCCVETPQESKSNFPSHSSPFDASDNAIDATHTTLTIPKKEPDSISSEVSLEIAHPMIVHEPSLSQEPEKPESFMLRYESSENVQEQSAPTTISSITSQGSSLQFQQIAETSRHGMEFSQMLQLVYGERSGKDESFSTVISSDSSTKTESSDLDRTTSTSGNYNSPVVTYASSSSKEHDSSTFNSTYPSSPISAKPSTSSFALQNGQTENDKDKNEPSGQQQQSSVFNGYYPFGLLYGGGNGGDDQPWSRYMTQEPISQFQEMDNEQSNYMDLDTYKITSCQLTTVPNIHTDEKMPAKGEISEQESNGDVDNSWSNPHYAMSSFRLVNSYEPYKMNTDWTENTDGDIPFSQDFAAEVKIDPLQTTSESAMPLGKNNFPAIGSDASILPPVPTIKVAKTSVCPRRPKQFQCSHCDQHFPLLKERSAHLIATHGYRRVNRRLIRDAPSCTVTTEHLATISVTGERQIQPNDNMTITATSATETMDDMKPKIKPEITVTSTSIDATVFPRTKYDAIRAGVYRMLMNFNLGVLKTKKVEFDESYFETKSFFCFTCNRNFISVKLYDEHLAEHPAECFTCNRKFTRWTYFSLHLKRHLGWKDFACTVCEKKFVIRSALVEHMRMHTGIAPLKCNMCEKAFKRYSNLTQHKKVCHSNRVIKKKDYVCYCGEVLASKARFLWHKETHETKPKVCPHCRDRFVHRRSLKRHIRLTHSDKFEYIQPVRCKECKQVYAKASMKAHMLTHSIDTQHECSICNKSFTTKWNLKIHSWVHANRAAKPFKCEHCIKAFVREVDYKNHINSHRNIKPFTCEYCGCKFIRKYNYIRHRKEHTAQKRFKCDLCDKTFHRNYYLIEHRRMHTGERPFLCTICGKSSTTKTNHNKHLKIHHSRDPFTSEA